MGTILRSFNAIRIFVDDLDRARRFYRDVLELDERSTGPDWAVFDIGGRAIVLERRLRMIRNARWWDGCWPYHSRLTISTQPTVIW